MEPSCSGRFRRDTEGSDRDSELSIRGRGPTRSMPVGILRLDITKPRRSSVDFKYLSQGEPPSPQPSVDRLSVTFAEDSLRSDSSTRYNIYNPGYSPLNMDKVHFPPVTDEEASEDEDYSASVTAIMQRRQSTRRSRRRSSRRASSPFSPDILPGSENGRRSSVFTTSSGDTAITVDESLPPEVTQDQIFENIRIHKEVLSSVKMQPWNMKKKLRLVVQAKNYIKRHEGALQERLAQSHSTRDMLARWNLFLIQKLQRYRREAANISNWFIPWELRIKEIESHFGSVVASYFIFLRWLFWVNLVTAAILIAFVYVPELLTADFSQAGERKKILPEDKYNSTNFLTLWDFEGIFKYSPLFYGWYTNRSEKGYKLPLAYFLTGLAVYTYSFVATLRKMAENSRMSKLSEKDDECIFSWKLFTGWDYMIGNAETAHNRVASIVMSFKEALLEEAEKKREAKSWKIIARRVLIHGLVFGLLGLSAYAVVEVVKRSKYTDANSTVWRRNETTVVVTIITNFFPILFEILGYFEQNHPRKQLRIQLARIMMLNLLNLYALIFALFDKIFDMSDDLEKFRNLTVLEANYTPTLKCNQICLPIKQNLTSANVVMLSAAVLSAFPKISGALTSTIVKISPNKSQDDLQLPRFILNDTDFYNFGQSFYDDNDTTPKNFDEKMNDFKTYFQDYLSYLLAGFQEEEIEETSIGNDTIIDSTTTYYSSFTDVDLTGTTEDYRDYREEYQETTERYQEYVDVTTSSPDDEVYKYFESTIIPTIKEVEKVELGESDIKNIHKNITKVVGGFVNETKQNCTEICQMEVLSYSICNSTMTESKSYSSQSCLRTLCWETMFGQEIVKLTVMDLVYTIGSTLMVDFLRGLFVRVMNKCWCWDLEKKFPNYGDFKVAENILHLVNNQGMVWMGMFFSPGLVVINVFKLYIILYLRSWAVLTCNVPHEIIFRASRSNNFYFALLLMMLFLCVLPVGFAIVWQRPSTHCGPFSDYKLIFHIFTTTLRNALPKYFHGPLDYIASPGIVIPLLVLLILIIYYLVSLTNSLREANNDLKIQLRRERTEERRKMFQIADRRRRNGSEGSGELGNTPFGKWRKLLQTLPSGKSLDETPKGESDPMPSAPKEIRVENVKRDFLSKLLNKALRKPSVTSEEESPPGQDDGTDTEQHESLPEDLISVKEAKSPAVKKSPAILAFRRSITTALAQKQSTKAIMENTNRESIDSDSKHVKISDAAPVSIHSSVPKRKDTFDLKRNQERKQKRYTQSPSRSNSSKDLRQDSLTSNWSEGIPAITITKTESAENIIDEKDAKKQKEDKKEESLKADKEEVKRDRSPSIRSFKDILGGKIEKHNTKKETPDKASGKKNEENKRSEFNAAVKPKLEGKAKDERRKYLGKGRDQERRPSKSRILNMEQTLDPIASSNDNLDSDTQEDVPKVRHALMKPVSDSLSDGLPVDLIQGTMSLPSTSRNKKFMLKKQHSEVGSDEFDEPTIKNVIQSAKSEESKKSANGESIKTIDTVKTESDTIKTESSTEYKDDIFSNDTIE